MEISRKAMAELIPPRRGQILIDSNGLATIRFLEYLESSSELVNESVDIVEVNEVSINPSAAALSAIEKRIGDLELLQPVPTNTSDLEKRIGALELLQPVPTNTNGLEKRIASLEVLMDTVT